MSGLPRRPLGGSGLDVSTLALGSWETFERISRDDGLAVMVAAREAGVDFLDDARYDDRTGTAPIRSGYSEVVFGELFRRSGWVRDEVVVANKLWWEFWPDESAERELDGSLGRLQLDHVDLIYAAPPPAELQPAELVGALSGLIATGKARAWGVLNWPAPLLAECVGVARAEALPGPCAAQLPYSVVRRDSVETPAMEAALAAGDVAVVASASLASGALTGKYAQPGARGRIDGALADPDRRRALVAGERLAAMGKELGASAGQLALAFALAGPAVASVLFGATSAAQVADNARAAEVAARLSADDLGAIRATAR